jgi:hypothetical protein
MRISDPTPPRCPRCDGLHLTRLMSRFATIRSEDDRLESLADPSQLGDLDENDPRSVARWMKKMGGAMGDDAGEDWDEMVDEATEQEAGQGEGDPSETSGDPDGL